MHSVLSKLQITQTVSTLSTSELRVMTPISIPADFFVNTSDYSDLRRSPIYLLLVEYFLVSLCMLCTAANISLLLQFPYKPSIGAELPKTDLQNLHHPSQYIHLDSIQYPSPPIHREFVNHPTFVSIVDREYPHKLADVDSRRYMSHNGMISPLERHFMVTDTVSNALSDGMHDTDHFRRYPQSYSSVQ